MKFTAKSPAIANDCMAAIVATAGANDRRFSESEVIDVLADHFGNREHALEAWDELQSVLRKPTLTGLRILTWNMFQGVLTISMVPSLDDLQRFSEMMTEALPRELEAQIETLTGNQFELLLFDLLEDMPAMRGLMVTSRSHDHGIDFRGRFCPAEDAPEWPLVGQAKHQSSPVSSAVAQAFVGAMATCGEKAPVGLFVSTSGFSEAAIKVFEACPFHVQTWRYEDLISRLVKFEIGVKKRQPDFALVDSGYWEELRASN